MTGPRSIHRLLAVVSCAALTLTGCAFHGLNSLPLPGAEGRGRGATTYHVEIANVSTLESNSPVMIDDVVVGSVGTMKVKHWHADVEIRVNPGVVVPANAVASVGQTSLLGSMHLALNLPPGQQASGRLQPGATIPLSNSSTYPSTEQTLSTLAAVVNGGGLGQIGDIVHNFNAALNGRESQIRDLLLRLDKFIGMFDAQRDDINASIDALNRLSSTLGGQRDVITAALHRIPPALDVLIAERPRITAALRKFGTFSDTATGLINDTRADLVRDLRNLEPTLQALADVGPGLPNALAYAPTFPYTQSFIDRAIRGDYMNLFLTIDLTIPRLKRTMFLGTRWGQEGAPLVPAPGDPWQQTYTFDPVGPLANMPVPPAPPSSAPAQPSSATQPVFPTAFPPMDEDGS